MSQPIAESLRTAWEGMSRRNDWLLVADQQAFLRTAAEQFAVLSDGNPMPGNVQLALLRAYGVLLYQGLRAHQERAAYELWLACYRLALRDGWAPTDAELVAQESVARVLEKLDALRAPESMLAWSLSIYRTVRMSLRKQAQAERDIQASDEAADQVAAAMNLAVDVEQQLLTTQLLDVLREKLPNQLERLVLIRVVMGGEQPRDVARDLGLPLHRTRLAKSRALQRLRGDPEFLKLLGESTDDIAEQERHPGVDDNDQL